MDGGYDKLQGGGEGLGGFMALLTDAPPPQPAPQQRLGSLAQPGPGEWGEAAGRHLAQFEFLGGACACWGRPPPRSPPFAPFFQPCPAPAPRRTLPTRAGLLGGASSGQLGSPAAAAAPKPAPLTPPAAGSGAAAVGAAGLTPAALQQQQHLQQQQQQQQQQLYAAPQAASLPGGYAGPAGGIPQQPLAGVNQGLYGGGYARPGGLGTLGLAGSMPTMVQQPNGGALPYAVPGGSLGAQVGKRG